MSAWIFGLVMGAVVVAFHYAVFLGGEYLFGPGNLATYMTAALFVAYTIDAKEYMKGRQEDRP